MKIKKTEFQKLYNIACPTWKSKFDEKFKNQLFSTTLEFEDSFIKEMYKACENEQKLVFEKIFQYKKDDLFSIKTYTEVCKKLKIKELTEKDFSFLPKEQIKKQLSLHKIQNISKLYNGDWEPNWNDINQYKYYPYFEYKQVGGFGFYSSHVYYSSSPGSVTYFKDKQTSDYVGKILIDIYNEFLIS